MRRLALIGLLLGAAPAARAEVAEVPPAPADPNRGDFWREVITPHADEIQQLIAKARNALQLADSYTLTDLDAAGFDVRARLYADAYGMMHYARRLAPEEVEVLTLLGRAADEVGKTRQAIDALQAAYALKGEQTSQEITGRLGAIYLRLGDLDTAIRYLRIAQTGLGSPAAAQVLVHLATALAARGEMGAAIDTLVGALPAQAPGYFTPEIVLVTFALAVQYDRDEQRSAAFEVLDRLQTMQQGSFASQVQVALAYVRFAPAEDQHYYQGLLYEAVGDYAEARAEWALFATSESPWRGRALDHIAAIDAQRRAKPGSKVPVPVRPTRIRPHRIP